MNDELRELARQAQYEAEVIGVSQQTRDDIHDAWERYHEERSMRVNRLHRGTKE